MLTEKSTPSGRVVPLHTGVRGRARLRVHGLYRSGSAATRLEASVRGHRDIRSIQANPRTGNVLVLFGPGLRLEEVCSIIESALGTEPFASVPRGKPPDRDQRDFHVARSLASAWRLAKRTRGRRSGRSKTNGNSQLIDVAFGPVAQPWHARAGDDIIRELQSSRTNGISAESLQRRLAQYGPNALPRAEARPPLALFVDQFKSLPVAMLGVSAGLSVLTGGVLDAVVIGSVVVTNALIGYATEAQTERTIRALSVLTPPNARVIRDGDTIDVSAEQVLPGDLLVLSRGTLIVADARVLDAVGLDIDESALTGESAPVRKRSQVITKEDTPLGDRTNMVYRGTMVTGGHGLAIVVETGLRTELGQVQRLVGQAEPPETPSQRELRVLGNQLVWAGLGICGGMFGIGMLRGYGLAQMARSSISLAVAALPEGLPTVAMTVLSLGVRDLRKRHALVRHLDAVETLGSPQFICLDKTGTITENRMSVVSLFADGKRQDVDSTDLREGRGALEAPKDSAARRLLEAVVLCSEVEIDRSGDGWTLHGTPTERALVDVALASGLDVEALRAAHPRVRLQPRSDDQNYMVSTHALGEGEQLLAVKGSPHQTLTLCDSIYDQGVVRPLDEGDRAAIEAENGRMAGKALRVLGVAHATTDGDVSGNERLTWLGLIAMTDPPRRGVGELIEEFHRAGINTAMITGDQSATAYAIAKELDLARDGLLEILDSTHMEEVPEEVLSSLAQRTQVFSRVSPAHKLEIVQALQRAGKVVAMTGDGINDGPALKAADVGIAMGRGGSEVAREVADVVLQRDELDLLVDAIRQGRSIHDNIRKSVHFLLSSNMSEILVMMGSISAGLGEPLTPIQLLWLNLITDIFPGLGLAVEPSEPDIMLRRPRDPEEPLMRRADFGRIAIEGSLLAGGTLGAYVWGLRRYGAGSKAGSLAFMTLTVAQLLHALSCRSEHRTIFDRDLGPLNLPLKLGVGGSLALQLAAGAIPGLGPRLGLSRLGLADWIAVGLGAGLPLLTNEALKKAGFWKREFGMAHDDSPADENGIEMGVTS